MYFIAFTLSSTIVDVNSLTADDMVCNVEKCIDLLQIANIHFCFQVLNVLVEMLAALGKRHVSHCKQKFWVSYSDNVIVAQSFQFIFSPLTEYELSREQSLVLMIFEPVI